MCEGGFYLGDTFYGLGCTRVDEAQLGGVVGAGLYDVRAVEGIDPLILTAHQSPQNACNFGGYEYDGPAWRVAYGPRFDAQALCDFPHLPERQRRVNDCPVGATEAETGP